MISVVDKFRKWLNPEQAENPDTDLYITHYLSLVTNSSKYADSNSNTAALERLIRLTAEAAKAKASEASSTPSTATAAEEDESEADRDEARKKKEEEEERRAKLIREEEERASDPYTLEALEPIISDMQKLGIGDQPDGTDDKDPNKLSEAAKAASKARYHQFRGQFNQHLNLMKELEDEALLHGQPCYQPPKFGKQGGNKFYLKMYPVPDLVYEAIDTNDLDLLKLGQPLTLLNYRRTFQNLLWLEEMHQAVELRRYDMEDVMLGKHQSLMVVPVPGLAEGRPSVMRGDRLILKSSKRGTLYEAYVHDVRSKDLLIKLHASLHSADLDGLRFQVRFMSCRTPFRRCHHGVQQFEFRPEMKDLLFPQPLNENRSARKRADRPFIDVREVNPENLRCFLGSLNIHQRRAVIGILKAESRPAPYIIFGPPGTGKTVSLVEAILQVYSRMPNSRILVCGNSNSCADVLAQRILNTKLIPKNQIIRLSAFYRMEKLVPPGLEGITLDMDSIDAQMYAESRIVVTTCIQSGALNNFKGRFDYLFLDEAGHASEPEAMIPVSLLMSNGCMVLAGDPHQLGPVVMSPVAAKMGLSESFLERLSKLEVYRRREPTANTETDSYQEEEEKDATCSPQLAYDERYITKLLISYRCDPRVLTVNNSLFYNDELEFKNETPKQWLQLLKLRNPLVFHGVKGKDRREFLNPSWFNPSEAIVCLTYAKRLYAGGLKASQLGIITPYRRQIHKLNLLFDGCNLERCKIATMEEFQGDEREVIIITTVRTRKSKMDVDQKFRLGFLFNDKRFNVGVSRAKWLVIVIGDPDVLKEDTCWSKYMEAAQKLGHAPTKRAIQATPVESAVATQDEQK